MAGANHYNKIQVARGDISKKTTPLYGELFYDVASKSVFIGAKEGNNVVWKRFGGFDSVVIKGTIDNTSFNQLDGVLPGDAYIVTGPISVSQNEIIFDGQGGVSRGKNYRTYDDFFKNGQVIVYVEEDVSAIPNALALTANPSPHGWIVLSGGQSAADIENDVSLQPVAEVAADPDDTAANATGLNNVQSALDYLFNNKMEYKGKTNEIAFDASSNGETALLEVLATASANNVSLSAEDAVIQAIANLKQLKAGEWIIYNGATKTISVDGTAYILKKNTAIVKTATVHSTASQAGLSNIVQCFPLGAADANDIEFQFTGHRDSDEAVPNVSTLSIAGIATTLDNTGNTTVDEKVQSVTQALDVLHQTKADLNSHGKIPLSQIPSTFVGALQFIGTLNFGSGTGNIAIPANGTLTAKQLAAYMSALDDPDSMEKANEGDFADKMHGELDAGDYVIINFATPTEANASVDDNASAANTKEITIIDDDDNVLFKVSSGDHVICNSINITTDDTVNPPTSTITSVKLDHLNTSASVDNINGLKAAVQIDGTRRNEQTSKAQASTTARELKETEVSVDAAHNIIDIGAPDTVLTPETTLGKNTIPVGNGGKALLNSEVSINGQDNPSNWHDTSSLSDPADITAAQAHNTELIGETKLSEEVTVEFPDESGKLLVNPEGNGTEDRLPKFDAHGNLIDSALENKIDQNLGGQFNVFDQNGNKVLTLNYEELAKLIQYTLGTGANAKDITRRFDDTDRVTTTEGGVETTVQVQRSSHEGRTGVDEDTHTMLDDCSTIDGGEWV